jgi:hypothetical protein
MKLLDIFLAILVTLTVIMTITVVNAQLQLAYEPYACYYFDKVENRGEYADEINCVNTDEWTCNSGNTYYSCLKK